MDELAVNNELKFNFYRLDELHVAGDHLPIEKIIVLQQPSFKRLDQIVIIIIILTVLVLCIPDNLMSLKLML